MTDLVERLRAGADDPMWVHHTEVSKSTLIKAADEITRLRAELHDLKRWKSTHAPRLEAIEGLWRDAQSKIEAAREAMETLASERAANAMLTAEVESMRPNDARYRYLRNRSAQAVLTGAGESAGCWIDCEVGTTLTLLTGDDADAAIDAAMGARP